MHYSMVIQWDPQDRIYVVEAPELPGCMTHGDTYEAAVAQGLDAIDSWVAAAQQTGLPVPAPRTYAEDEVTA
jgi:predicted RNase H-like HicB family nuclease